MWCLKTSYNSICDSIVYVVFLPFKFSSNKEDINSTESRFHTSVLSRSEGGFSCGIKMVVILEVLQNFVRSHQPLWMMLSGGRDPDNNFHGTHVGPVGPRWAPCWPHEPCYQGRFQESINSKRNFQKLWPALWLLGLLQAQPYKIWVYIYIYICIYMYIYVYIYITSPDGNTCTFTICCFL